MKVFCCWKKFNSGFHNKNFWGVGETGESAMQMHFNGVMEDLWRVEKLIYFIFLDSCLVPCCSIKNRTVALVQVCGFYFIYFFLKVLWKSISNPKFQKFRATHWFYIQFQSMKFMEEKSLPDGKNIRFFLSVFGFYFCIDLSCRFV